MSQYWSRLSAARNNQHIGQRLLNVRTVNTEQCLPFAYSLAGRVGEKVFDIAFRPHRHDGETSLIKSHCANSVHRLCQHKRLRRFGTHATALNALDA